MSGEQFSRPVKNSSGVPPSVREEQANLTDPYAYYSGFYGQEVIEPHPQINQAASEKVIQGKNNQFIVIGRDRPAGIDTGYGASGDTHCGSIDLIAGMSGIQAREYDPKTGKPVLTEKSTTQDAARIYISQKADVDSYFGIVDGSIGSSKTKSGIMIKADAVRLMGREGIKLVTMADRYASPGYEGLGAYGIDLIAGNDDKDLQPIPKGENLRECLEQVMERLCDLSGIVNLLMKTQSDIYQVIVTHQHSVPPTTDPKGTLVALPSGNLLKDITVPGFRLKEFAKIAAQIKTFQDNINDLYGNYLLPIPNQSYILSYFNNTN